MQQYSFLSQKQHYSFSILRTGFTMGYWPKPPLHELNLRKSPIKNHRNFISGQIII